MKGIFRTRETSDCLGKVCAFPALDSELEVYLSHYRERGYSVDVIEFDDWNRKIERFFMDGDYRCEDNLVYCYDHFKKFIKKNFGVNVRVVF